MSKELVGKTALVTGSGRNNGRAIALELADMGANVVVNARSNETEAASVVAEIDARGAKAFAVVDDISRQETVDRIRVEADARFGGVDIYVSNAAVRPFQPFADMSFEDWSAIINVQLHTSFRLAKALTPRMIEKGWGRVIHITGPDSFSGLANRAHNVAAKGGLRALTKALAVELGPHGITVNDVAPGRIDHPDRHLSHPAMSGDGPPRRSVEEQIRTIPVRRLGTPEDVAYACGFLASPRAGFFTGTALCCFGGRPLVP